MEITQLLSLYIAGHRHKKFEWGVNDCNTFIVRWHDYAHGTKYYDELMEDAYNDRNSALKYLSKGVSHKEWFDMAGYINVHDRPQTTDIITDRFSAYIVFGVFAYSLVEEHQGYTRQLVEEVIAKPRMELWRLTNG